MKKIRLIDACFPGNPSSIAGDNVWRGPTHFEWCREECDSLSTWFTNWTVLSRKTLFYPNRVAWLLEPPWSTESIDKKWPYQAAADYRNQFAAIITYDDRLINSGDSRFKFAPHGGSWIDWDLWGMYEKNKDVCMIVSDKNESEGHKLRHEIAKEFGERIDVYGPSYKRFDRKFDVLRDYRYCVVVESVKMDYYFSEKLIDPISVGTIPIYWGCPSIGKWFFEGGIIQFSDIDQIDGILKMIASPHHYPDKEVEILRNCGAAEEFRMPEDYMFKHYPELFK